MGIFNRFIVGVATAVLLVACNPAFNWREVRVGEVPVLALMPCKPDKAERTVSLQGQPATLHMASCDVGSLTFAFAALGVSEGMDPGVASHAWKLATLASLKAPLSGARDWPLPQRTAWSATGWQADGVRHNGQAVHVRVVAVARGQSLHQLAIYGDPPPEVLATWLDGMRFVAVP